MRDIAAGQQVVWLYRPQTHRHRVYLVDAEIAQVSTLRIRIRIRTATGQTGTRWVKSNSLRAKTPDEPPYLYPESY